MRPSPPRVNTMLYLHWLLAILCVLGGSAGAQTCLPPPAGLVSWWPGDGNAQDIIGPNDGMLQGGTTFAPGRVGQAFRFDGTDDYVRIPHHPSLNPTSALTIEAWIHSASTEGPRVIVSKWGNFDDSYIFKDHNESDKLRIELSETVLPDLADLEGSTSIPLETWVHVATTYDATEGPVRLYFNGREDASLFVGLGRLIHSSLTDVLIGAFEGTTEEGVLEHFAGRIDEVSIYNRALSAEEIAAIFNAGSAGKCKDTEVQEVTIDIKPGNFPNSINPKSRGVIPVAILTPDTFDATTVDPLSVRFGPGGAQASPKKGHIKDVNHDGEPDLVLHFRTQETGIQCGDTSASLTGETVDGDPIQGSDAIKTVGCNK